MLLFEVQNSQKKNKRIEKTYFVTASLSVGEHELLHRPQSSITFASSSYVIRKHIPKGYSYLINITKPFTPVV